MCILVRTLQLFLFLLISTPEIATQYFALWIARIKNNIHLFPVCLSSKTKATKCFQIVNNTNIPPLWVLHNTAKSMQNVFTRTAKKISKLRFQ